MSHVQMAVLSDKGASSSTLFMIFQGTEKEKGRIERNTMAQWMNLHQNNSFINRLQLPLLCEISGIILVLLVGLMAASLAGNLVGSPAVRRNTGKKFNSLQVASLGFSQHLTKVQC